MSNIKTIPFGNKHTPEQTLLDALNSAEDAECIVIVQMTKDGYVETSWSNGSLAMRLGMLDMAKVRMFDIGQEGE